MNFTEFKNKYQKEPITEFENNVKESIPEPVVSVMIITYMHVKYINDTIEGVLKQNTNFPYEIIIGDDESTDGTRDICMGYARKYPEKIRLFLHKRENNIKVMGQPGPIFQFIHNLFNLRGKYIAIISGDDFWTDPLKLQKQVDFLEKHPETVMSFHNTWVINSDKVRYCKQELLSEVMKYPPDKTRIDRKEQICSMVYRNILDCYPEEFTEVLNEDEFLMFLLSRYGKKEYQNNIYPAIYRIHGNSMYSSTTVLNKLENKINTFTQILRIAENGKERKFAELSLLLLNTFKYYNLLRNKQQRSRGVYHLKKTAGLAFSQGHLLAFLRMNINSIMSLFKKLVRKIFETGFSEKQTWLNKNYTSV